LEKKYDEIMASDEIKNCKKNGGKIEKDGLAQFPICVIKYPDAGKLCHDNSECKGGCIAVNAPSQLNKSAEGKCKETNSPFGCYATVVKGKAIVSMCVD
jgi:hypothetical protein